MTQATDNQPENGATSPVEKTGDNGLDSLATLRAIAAGRRGFAAAADDPPPPAPPPPAPPKSAARLDATGLSAPEGPSEFQTTAGDAPLSASRPRETESVAAERAGDSPAGAGTRGDGMTTLLAARGVTHGPWTQQAVCAQAFKDMARAHPGWARLLPTEREAVEMFFVKLSRVLTGQPHFQDHWDDMAGYLTLAAKTLACDRSHNA